MSVKTWLTAALLVGQTLQSSNVFATDQGNKDQENKTKTEKTIAPKDAAVPEDNGQQKPLKNGPHKISTIKTGHDVTSHIYLDGNAEGHALGYYRENPSQKTHLEFPNVLFEKNSADLNSNATNQLKEYSEKIKDFLGSHPNTVLKVAGHASADGDAKYNLKLSEKRMENVSSYLKNALGDQSEKVVLGSSAHGENKQVSNDLAQNRRVELSITDEHKTNYKEFFHIQGNHYEQMSKAPFTIDLGKGAETQRVYGKTSKEEAHATIILEPNQGAHVAKIKIIVEDPDNLTIAIRSKDGNISQASVLETPDGNKLFYSNGQLLANMQLQNPQGEAVDINKVKVLTVDLKGQALDINNSIALNGFAKDGKTVMPSGKLTSGSSINR